MSKSDFFSHKKNWQEEKKLNEKNKNGMDGPVGFQAETNVRLKCN
jgi:hypothetical protein